VRIAISSVPPNQAYTVEEAMSLLRMGRETLYQYLRTGELRSVKLGRLRRITGEHLAEFLRAREARVESE